MGTRKKKRRTFLSCFGKKSSFLVKEQPIEEQISRFLGKNQEKTSKRLWLSSNQRKVCQVFLASQSKTVALTFVVNKNLCRKKNMKKRKLSLSIFHQSVCFCWKGEQKDRKVMRKKDFKKRIATERSFEDYQTKKIILFSVLIICSEQGPKRKSSRSQPNKFCELRLIELTCFCSKVFLFFFNWFQVAKKSAFRNSSGNKKKCWKTLSSSKYPNFLLKKTLTAFHDNPGEIGPVFFFFCFFLHPGFLWFFQK